MKNKWENSEIKKVLMERDSMSEKEAIDLLDEAKEAFDGYLDEGDSEAAENICAEYFGLEPDYLIEFT